MRNKELIVSFFIATYKYQFANDWYRKKKAIPVFYYISSMNSGGVENEKRIVQSQKSKRNYIW